MLLLKYWLLTECENTDINFHFAVIKMAYQTVQDEAELKKRGRPKQKVRLAKIAMSLSVYNKKVSKVIRIY
jgi:hypothetical protein